MQIQDLLLSLISQANAISQEEDGEFNMPACVFVLRLFGIKKLRTVEYRLTLHSVSPPWNRGHTVRTQVGFLNVKNKEQLIK